MKITLVNPPYPQNAHSHPPFIPLGIAYLGAASEKSRTPSHSHRLPSRKTHTRNLPQKTRNNTKPHHRRNSHHTPLQIRTKNNHHRQTNPPTKHNHSRQITPKLLGRKQPQKNPNLDIVVRREGEATFLEILKKLENKNNLNGVLGTTYRTKDGKINRNEDRPFIENLDELPFPAHHLLPLNAFHRMGKTIFPLTTSRGCIYWCDFCSTVRMLSKKYRMRTQTTSSTKWKCSTTNTAKPNSHSTTTHSQ